MPSSEWIERVWSLEYQSKSAPAGLDAFGSVVLRTPGRCAYALIRHDGQPISLAQLVVSRGWGGLQCVVTDPAVRRMGLATAVVQSLTTRARALGVSDLYLAMTADNQAALALYRSLGFEIDHTYCYWTASVATR